MKLLFVFTEDEEVLLDSRTEQVKARVPLATAKPTGEQSITLTIEDDHGNMLASENFDGTEQDVLKKHRLKLLEFLKRAEEERSKKEKLPT